MTKHAHEHSSETFAHADHVVASDLKHHDVEGAQTEINHYRKEHGNTLSKHDTERFNETLHKNGFPDLEVQDVKGHGAYIVSKEAVQAEHLIASSLKSGSEMSRAPLLTLYALKELDGNHSKEFKNDVDYINKSLAAQSLPTFKYDAKTHSWTIQDTKLPPSSPSQPGASTPPESQPSSPPESNSGSEPASFGGYPSGYAPPSGGDTGGSTGGSSSGDAGNTPYQPSGTANPSDFTGNSGSEVAQYAQSLIKYLNDVYHLNIPMSQANIQFFEAWQKAEGGGAGADGDAHYNPFNTTESAPGATSINSAGVKSYTSLQEGVQATAKTLVNGDYNKIIKALQSGNSAMADAQAEAATPWGTGSLIEQVLGG